MNPDLCYSMSGKNDLCKRKDVLKKLQELVKEIEKFDNYKPKCRIDSEIGERVIESTQTQFYPTVTLDGQQAKPVVLRSRSQSTWCPPRVKISPPSNCIHSCYKTLGDPEHITSDGAEAKRKRSLPEGDCRGQQFKSIEPVQVYPSPGSDPTRTHWTPPPTTDCMYPNTCGASCFLHPAVNDWTYQQPSYRCYLQDNNDKPFLPGF